MFVSMRGMWGSQEYNKLRYSDISQSARCVFYLLKSRLCVCTVVSCLNQGCEPREVVLGDTNGHRTP